MHIEQEGYQWGIRQTVSCMDLCLKILCAMQNSILYAEIVYQTK